MTTNSIILADIGAVVGNIVSIVALCLIVTFIATFIAGAIASKQQKEIVRLKAELRIVEVYAADQNREKRQLQNKLIAAYAELVLLQQRVNSKNAPTKVIRDRILTPDMIMNLIKLCHPDKHGGSHIATEVTQQLLDLKKKRK